LEQTASTASLYILQSIHPASKLWQMWQPALGTRFSCSPTFPNRNRIWLEELHSNLGDSVNFTGFDISAAQFPKDGKAEYIVHDMLKPFPAKYHGLYDLIHVRYLVLAFKKDQYAEAVQNLVPLLSVSSAARMSKCGPPHFARILY
jgi:hypothetical protein